MMAAPSTALSRGSLMLLSLLFPSHPIYMVGHTALEAWQRVTQSLCLPYMVGGSSFPLLVPSNDTVDSASAMGIKPGDSGVMNGCQVDEFTHTWSVEQFVALSHIRHGFTGKVSSLTHFTLELGCENYSFLDQAVADFEQSLDSISPISLRQQNWTVSVGGAWASHSPSGFHSHH